MASPLFLLRPGDAGRTRVLRDRRAPARHVLNRALTGDPTPGGHLVRVYQGPPEV